MLLLVLLCLVLLLLLVLLMMLLMLLAPIALFGAAPIAGVVADDWDVIKKCDVVYLFFHVLMTA